VGGAAEVPGELDDAVLVETALDDCVDLTGNPAAAAASIRRAPLDGTSMSFIARNVASSSASRLTVTRARPASASAWPFAEQRSVRRQGQIHVQRGEHLDEPLDVPADERLAARDSDLAHAVCDEGLREPCDLLVVEQLRARQELVVAPKISFGMQ